jgi:hypothetical protein
MLCSLSHITYATCKHALPCHLVFFAKLICLTGLYFLFFQVFKLLSLCVKLSIDMSSRVIENFSYVFSSAKHCYGFFVFLKTAEFCLISITYLLILILKLEE